MGIRICLDEVLKKKGNDFKRIMQTSRYYRGQSVGTSKRKSQRYPFAYDESYLLFPSM